MSLAIQALNVFTLGPSFIFQVFSPCFNHVKMVEGDRHGDKDTVTRQNPNLIQGQWGWGNQEKDKFL